MSESQEDYNNKKQMDMAHPLYIHPSDSLNPLSIGIKLSGLANYYEWKREMEVALATKRKLGILTGLVKRSTTDPVLAEAYDTCNSLLVGWLCHNLEGPIKASVMYVNSAKDIWECLNRTYGITNGARKYQIDLEIQEAKQGTKSISEYHTYLVTLWQTLEMMEDWPPFTENSVEINKFWEVLTKYREEKKLYKFLNGLDPSYGPLRSQLLLRNPLPRVDEAASLLQHEEIQKQVLEGASKMEVDQAAFYSNHNSRDQNNNYNRNDNTNKKECVICKKKGHTKDECWWNKDIPNNPGPPPRKDSQKSHTNKWQTNNKGKKVWNKSGNKFANNAAHGEGSENTGNIISMTQDQFMHLLNKHKNTDSGPYTEEELEAHFAGLLDSED